MQRPDPGINDLIPGMQPAILAPKIMVDLLHGIVIARAQRAGAEAKQLACQQARAVPLEFQAQIPRAPPVKLHGVEVVDPGGNAGLVAFSDPPPHPAQRLKGQPAQGMEDRERVIGLRQVLLPEAILHAQAWIRRKAADEGDMTRDGPDQAVNRVIKRHKRLRHLLPNQLKAYQYSEAVFACFRSLRL